MGTNDIKNSVSRFCEEYVEKRSITEIEKIYLVEDAFFGGADCSKNLIQFSIKKKAEKLETQLISQMNILEKKKKKYSESRLFNLYLGKVFGMYELLNELDMKEEAASLEWAYKFGI